MCWRFIRSFTGFGFVITILNLTQFLIIPRHRAQDFVLACGITSGAVFIFMCSKAVLDSIIIMSNPSDEQLRQAIDGVFNKYDVDKNNTLDESELKNVLNDAFTQLGATRGVNESDLKKFRSAVDKNNDGKVTKMELFEIFKKLALGGTSP